MAARKQGGQRIAQGTEAKDVLIRTPEVIRLTGISRTEVYRLVRRRAFPAPAKVGARAIAFSAREVHQWISQRLAERGGE